MSIGGFLGPVLAGLSGYAEQQKQAEQNRIRQQEAQMRQQLFQNYLKTQQDTEATDKAGLDYFRGGGLSLGQGGLSQPQPIGGGGGDLPELGAGGSPPASNYTAGKGRGFDVAGLYDLAVKAGFKPGEEAATHAATMMAESSGNPDAHNKDGEDSIGLNQINRRAWGMDVPTDPLGNTKFAHDVVFQKQGWPAWSAYKSGAYKQFLPEAMAAARRGGPQAQGLAYGGADYPAPPGSAADKQSQGDARVNIPHPGLSSAFAKARGSGFKGTIQDFQRQGGSGSTGPTQPAAGAGDEDGGGGGDAGDGATAPMAQIEITPAEKKEAKQLEVRVAQLVDPMARGKMSLEGLIGAIDKAAPNASSHARMQAVEKYYKLFLAPQEQERRREDLRRLRDADAAGRQRALFEHQDKSLDRRQRQQFEMEDRREKMRQEQQDRQFRQQNEMLDKRQGGADERADKRTRDAGEMEDKRQKDRLEREGWSIETDADGTRYRYNKITGQARPLTGEGEYKPQTAQPRAGAAPKSRNVEVMDGEGKVVFRGLAHQKGETWVSDKDQKPIEVPEDGSIRASSTAGGPGKQAAAQLNRVIAAGNELSGGMRDLLDLPSGSVAGMFQGLQGMPADSLGEAMRRSLANKLTDEASSDVKIGFQGIARFVASLEAFGAATGLVGLTKSAEVYMPQTGDTMGNVLRKYATLRRDAERALEAGAASPDIGQDQKKLIEKVRKELSEAVPFTVSDVNKLQHGDAETYRDVAKKLMGGGGVPAEAAAALKGDPSPERRKQFDEIFGAGAAARALGE